MTEKEHDSIRRGSELGDKAERPALETQVTKAEIDGIHPEETEPQERRSGSRQVTTSNPQMRNVAASVVVSEILRELDRGI